MEEEQRKNDVGKTVKKESLRSGFTTGATACAAAAAAADMVLRGVALDTVSVKTPGGSVAKFSLLHVEFGAGKAVCAVRKDAGDDPDVTDKALIFASVETEKNPFFEDPAGYLRRAADGSFLYLSGGPGIGVVTRPGLPCPVGKAAINPVPRTMIFDEVERVKLREGYPGALLIRIWVPEGERLAPKTFNPKLGIMGGISILGTSGIVNPMSEAALVETIRMELRMKAAEGAENVIVTPGNYGETFLKTRLGLSLAAGIRCSNFVADAVEMAAEEGIRQVLFVGHLGKLVKVAGGMRNTHSKYGDRRMESLWDCVPKTAVCSGKTPAREGILSCNTTDEAAALLREWSIADCVLTEVAMRVKRRLEGWTGGALTAECVVFANPKEVSHMAGTCAMSAGAKAMIAEFQKMEERDRRKAIK